METGNLSAARRASRPGGRRFSLHGLARRIVQAAHLIAHADQEHGLLGVLENVDDALLLVLQVNRLTVGDQMKIGVRLQDIRQALAHLALQKPQDAPDLLQ